ncbi:AraC family transcriptional regulator [Chryseobacterium vrystaatense]|uniref:AraC family transcriptional regulator n=1 Tax=Chryseobacterium vrystaatense TaxID=307480 RepID=UPI00068E1771|nr:AraC family transcriptional regulator [Chryseobacterium vrystaatense]
MNSEIIFSNSTHQLLFSSPQKNDYYTVILCLKGNVSVKIGYHSFELQPKMISILSPDTVFSCENADSLEILSLCFHQSFLSKIFIKKEITDGLLELNPNYPPVYPLEDSFYRVFEKFRLIERELITKSAYHLDLVRLVALEILYEYNRACEFCLLGFEKNMNRGYQITYEFKKLVGTHFKEWKSVGDYSFILGISAKHLTEVIKEETGHTALQVIHERLLLESRYLLKHTSCSIKECAYALGFESPSYFTRFFKNNTGYSPNQYRNIP